jgi:hydrogenase-1 operon protein HyaF
VRTIPIHIAPDSAELASEQADFEALRMPQVEPLETPLPPAGASAADRAAGASALERFLVAMREHRFGTDATPHARLGELHASARAVLDESLGQGEVSAIVRGADGAPDWLIQETAFAGVWRVRRGRGDRAEELLEAGDIPQAIRAAAERQPPAAQLDAARLPEGVMNAPALVNEIRYHARRCVAGRPARVVNLSLLPLNAADRDGLEALLGAGPVAVLSRGFGNCRISSTAVRGVWRVQYFNSMSTLILDTIEVVDLPEAARATAEDYADSIVRLEELLAWLREA